MCLQTVFSIGHCSYLLWRFRAWAKSRGRTQDSFGKLPAPAVKARLGELWTGFVCADGCCALQFVNCIEFPTTTPALPSLLA